MLKPEIKKLAEGPNFAALATLTDDGAPANYMMWVDCDDEHIIVNTEVARAKFGHVRRDPRVAVSIIDADNPYAYAEVRGRVVDIVRGPEAREHIDQLSYKYNNKPYDESWIQSERVILKIAPRQQRIP